jgi:hypothetical protein
MVGVIDGFVSDRLQQDHGSIVTVESKMNLDRSLQPLTERGSEPSDRKQTSVSRQICRSCEGDKRGSDRGATGRSPIHFNRWLHKASMRIDFLHRRIGDRDFEMSNSLDNENPEIAICDFAI